MAAKLKKRNPFLAFLIYFLSISVFWGSLYVIILGLGNSILSPDYKLSRNYRKTMTDLLAAGYVLADPHAEIIWIIGITHTIYCPVKVEISLIGLTGQSCRCPFLQEPRPIP